MSRPGDVFAGAGIAGHADESDPVEAVTVGPAARSGNGRDVAERREGCPRAQAVGVSSGGHQELGRSVGPIPNAARRSGLCSVEAASRAAVGRRAVAVRALTADWAALWRVRMPLTVSSLGMSLKLRRLGLGGLAGRSTARLALAVDVPASILAALTRTSIDNATDWANFGRRNWTDYIASRKDP